MMQEFDANFSELIQEALHIAFEYTDYSGEIEGIYIYISLELGGDVSRVLSYQWASLYASSVK